MAKINFTKRFLDSLLPPKTGMRSSYNDSKINSLIIRITDTGRKTFQVYKKHNGRPIRVTIGTYPETSIENARKEAINIIAELTKGKNPNIEKQKIRQDITLKTAFDDYIERYAKVHKKTWQYDKKQFERYLSSWSFKKLSTIKKQDIEKLHINIKQEHGLYAANRLLSFLKTFFNKIIEWGWDGVNPAKGIKKFKEKSRERFIQPNELPKFFKALNKETNQTVKDYIWLSLLTGARKNNVLSMHWDEIDFRRKIWRIPETKNGEPLDIPLVNDAIGVLKARKKDKGSEWVFPSLTSTSGHLEEPKKVWRRILDSAGIQDLRLHDLRRTLGSYQAITGASLQIIGKTLGHKSQQATQVYSRLNDDPVRASIEKATKAIQGFAAETDVSK